MQNSFFPLLSSLKYRVLPLFVFVLTEWNNVENYNEKRKFSNVSTGAQFTSVNTFQMQIKHEA